MKLRAVWAQHQGWFGKARPANSLAAGGPPFAISVRWRFMYLPHVLRRDGSGEGPPWKTTPVLVGPLHELPCQFGWGKAEALSKKSLNYEIG